MNKQGKSTIVDGKRKIIGGIEWVKTILPDGNEEPGYTWNPMGGCPHGCQWIMPDGSKAICYANTDADHIARQTGGKLYGEGFDHHYWYPERLGQPKAIQKGARVFAGSMTDLFSAQVPDWQTYLVMDAMCDAKQHTFITLTKAYGRLAKFDLPPNVWVGTSVPPSIFRGREIQANTQVVLMHSALKALAKKETATVRWLSAEPLSFDVADVLEQYPGVIQWMVIGAASSGAKKYPPRQEWVDKLHEVAAKQGIAIFDKGNMTSLAGYIRQENFPVA